MVITTFVLYNISSSIASMAINAFKSSSKHRVGQVAGHWPSIWFQGLHACSPRNLRVYYQELTARWEKNVLSVHHPRV